LKKEIPVPKGLTERQIYLAKAFVKERHETGISIADFCKNHGISLKTWYEWLKDDVFESYLTALGGSIISDDERQAYQQVKKKIMQMATKQNASVREIELFLNTFSYVVEAEKQERMKELGIVPAHEKANEKTLEEKKAILVSRLKGDAEK
jgi:cysteine synthase